MCEKLEVLIGCAISIELMVSLKHSLVSGFLVYRIACTHEEGKPFTHLTGRRRAVDTQVCSGCVMGHVVRAPLFSDGPGAMAEQKILEAKHLCAHLELKLLGFYICLVPFPAKELIHSDNNQFSMTSQYGSGSFYHNLDMFLYVDS